MEVKIKDSRIMPSVMLGMMFMTFGLLFLLNNMHILSLGHSLRFWPLLTLVPLGLERLWTKGVLQSLWGHVLLLGGLAAQALCLDYEDWLEKWWPAGILWIGLIITLKALHGQYHKNNSTSAESDERLS